MSATPAEAAAIDRRQRRNVLLTMIACLPLLLAMIYFVPNVGPVYRVYTIPASSMAPAVPRGSHAVVSRAAYGYSRHSFELFPLPIAGRWPDRVPARGDIAVFRLPRDHHIHYIKRVIGLPGDRIQILKGRLHINGVMVRREPAGEVTDPDPDVQGRPVPAYVEHLPEGVSYRILETQGDTGPFDNTAVFIVPAGHYFVLGDNRDNSTDSRAAWGVGFVPLELFIGRVALVLGGAAQ